MSGENVFIHVYSHKKFDELMKTYGWTEKTVPANCSIISICCTPEIKKNYLEDYKHETDEHWFKQNTDNILNLEFDDIEMDSLQTKYGMAYGITDEQAKTLVEFVKKQIDKYDGNMHYWYIHCRAGRSRSVAVGEFIEEVCIASDSPDLWPRLFLPHSDDDVNVFVYSKLRAANKN